MDLAAVFAAIPGAVPFADLPDTWFWTHAPNFGNVATVSDGHAFQSYAHDSYDEDTARALVTFARAHSELVPPSGKPLAIVEGLEHPRFDAVVAFGPVIHRYHAENPEVHDRTLATFPAYRCEYSGAESSDDAQFRFARAAGAQPSRWNRDPNPYLKMRHVAASGREIAKRGFANPPKLLNEINELPTRPNGFVEFENYLQLVWTVIWDETFVLSGQDEQPRKLGFDELVEFLKDTLLGPNRAAGDSSFTKN